MARKARIGLFDYLGIMVMIIGLLFAGPEVNSQERQFSDPFHLGNIQELRMDTSSQIELLKRDQEFYLNCQKTFKEKGNKEAYLWASEILKRIETDLEKLQSL